MKPISSAVSESPSDPYSKLNQFFAAVRTKPRPSENLPPGVVRPAPSTRTFAEYRQEVPAELQTLRQWVCYRSVWKPPQNQKPGYFAKVPYQTNGVEARADDPATWNTFESVAATVNSDNRFDGIGVEFSAPYLGIDLDHCFSGEGKLLPWAKPIVDALLLAGVPLEKSQSGMGLHGYAKGEIPEGWRNKVTGLGDDRIGAIEIYTQGRYFVVTGCIYRTLPSPSLPTVDLHTILNEQLFLKPVTLPHSTVMTPPQFTDEEIKQKLFSAKNADKINALWNGADSAHDGDPSKADSALCHNIAFYTGPNGHQQIERIFSSSKRGERSKWKTRPDYRERTIADVLATQTEFYQSHEIPGVPTTEEEIAKLPTDVGMAAKFAQQHRDHLIHVPGLGHYVYDNIQWKRDVSGQAISLAKQTVLKGYGELQNEPDGEKRKATLALIERYQRRERLMAMIDVAKPDLAKDVIDLDVNVWLLNCRNGTINLRTGALQAHDAKDFITKACAVDFNPNAKCPLWESVLRRSFADDDELVSYIQKLFGMCLAGDISVQEFFVFWGMGNNGKNLMLDTLLALMGEYAYRAPEGLITENKRGEHPTEIAALLNRRLVVASETENGAKLRLQLVKRMTGDSTMTGRFIRENYFTFNRHFKTILLTNNKPRITETGDAAWRRIRLVPFRVVIPNDEIDTQLPNKLLNELPGILAWAVRGCTAWQHEGLRMPQAVAQATAEYRQEEDVIGRFLDEFCICGEGETVFADAVYEQYSMWCKDCNSAILSRRKFDDALEQSSVATIRGARDSKLNKAIWVGLKLQRSTVTRPEGIRKMKMSG
jgi:putative DNA primase/helicase